MDIETRNIRSEDLEALMHWRMEEGVQESSIEEAALSAKGQAEWFEKIDKSRYFITEVNGQRIGTFNFKGSSLHDRYVWSFHLNPAFRGQAIEGVKYSRILCEQALGVGFNQLGANKIVGQVLASNTRSVSLHESLGFREEGLFKQDVKKRGQYLDLYQFAIFREDYQEKLMPVSRSGLRSSSS